MVYETDIDLYRTWWKRTRAVTQGFQKAYRAKTPAGDHLQVEFNFHDSLVKIQVEPSSEKGSTYTSTIKKGTIIRERDVLHGVSVPLKKKFFPFKTIFSCLPDEDILDTIGGTYDISKVPLFKFRNTPSMDIEYETTEEVKEKYVPWFNRFIGSLSPKNASQSVYIQKLKERAVDDVNDSILGFSIAAVIYFHFFDFIVLGWSLALFGFLFGGVDWVLRDRDPLMLKILLFLCIGSYFFYTGYTRF